MTRAVRRSRPRFPSGGGVALATRPSTETITEIPRVDIDGEEPSVAVEAPPEVAVTNGDSGTPEPADDEAAPAEEPEHRTTTNHLPQRNPSRHRSREKAVLATRSATRPGAARKSSRVWPEARSRRREASRWDSGYPADGVDHTLSTLIFNRVLNAARCSSPIPMLTA